MRAGAGLAHAEEACRGLLWRDEWMGAHVAGLVGRIAGEAVGDQTHDDCSWSSESVFAWALVEAVRRRQAGKDGALLDGLRVCITGFEDCKCCVTGFGGFLFADLLAVGQRKALEGMIMAHGAEYQGDLTREVTHLVAAAPKGRKFEHARLWGIKCVSLEWLTESVRQGLMLDESLYERWEMEGSPEEDEDEESEGDEVLEESLESVSGETRSVYGDESEPDDDDDVMSCSETASEDEDDAEEVRSESSSSVLSVQQPGEESVWSAAPPGEQSNREHLPLTPRIAGSDLDSSWIQQDLVLCASASTSSAPDGRRFRNRHFASASASASTCTFISTSRHSDS